MVTRYPGDREKTAHYVLLPVTTFALVPKILKNSLTSFRSCHYQTHPHPWTVGHTYQQLDRVLAAPVSQKEEPCTPVRPRQGELEHARNTRERKETKRKGMGSEGDEPGQFDCGDVIVAWCMGARVFFLPLARLKFTIYFCKLFYTF